MGAVYRTHESGSDSSLRVDIGPGDFAFRRTAQRQPATKLGLFQTFGNVFDAFGEPFDVRKFHGAVPIVLGIPQGIDLGIDLGQLVSDQQTHHHEEARVAYLTDRRDQFIDPLIDILGKPSQMRFLAVIAGDFVLFAVNRDDL